MAAIGNEDGHVDMCRVSRAALSLPSYARPIFVRLLRTSADSHMTGRVILKNSLMAEQSSDKSYCCSSEFSFYEGEPNTVQVAQNNQTIVLHIRVASW